VADGLVHSSQSQIAVPPREPAFFTHRRGRFRGRAVYARLVRGTTSLQTAEIIRLVDTDKRGDPMSFTRYGSLEGRTVIITGGASVIGASWAAALVENGAKVAFLARQRATGAALAASLGECAVRPLFVPCDLTDAAGLRAALGKIPTALGPAAV